MVRSLYRARISLLAALALIFPMVSIAATPAAAAPSDDTPVLLTPKGEREDGSEELGSFDKLRDAYYWSRLLAGDEEMTFERAATLRSQASSQASTFEAETQRGAARGGTWNSVGPDPIVQVGRTTNTFEAVSGRIGALAIRNDGTIILGAAQGGIWTYDSASKTWTSRT